MKKTPSLLMLLSIMIISLTQSCNYDGKKVGSDRSQVLTDTVNKPNQPIYERKDTLAIYLTSVKIKEGKDNYRYRLAMFDANGDCGIDSFVTGIKHVYGKSGKIQWIKVIGSGIKEITEIKYTGSDTPRIFKNPVHKQSNGVWNLNLPDTIEIPKDRPYIQEKYQINYIPEGSKDTVIIDPYLRVPPN